MNEQKQKLTHSTEEIYKLAKENNKMLHAIRRDAFVGGVIKFVFWIIILVVLPYISWLFLQPYLEGALNTINQVQGSVDTINTTAQEVREVSNSIPDLGEFLKQFGVGN